MELSQDNSLSLLGYYQNYPVLWDPKDEFYYNHLKKEDAWSEISSFMQISKDECRKKIESLKGSYRREKARTKKSKTTGQGTEAAYKSKWFAFNAMTFLDKKTEPRETDSNLNSEETDSIIEESDSATSISTPNTFKAPKGPPFPKRKKNEKIEEAFEYLRKAAEEDTSQDECTSFGLYVANKLKKYTEQERAIAQHRISNIFFEIDMTKYSNYQTPLKQNLQLQQYFSFPQPYSSTSTNQQLQRPSPVQSPNPLLSVTTDLRDPSPASQSSDSAQSHSQHFSDSDS